ncbi:MAG TPA: SMP-30/gluconolactonase/LRE family protein [Allosphingosinicella sp.]|nr:SMP-30/gluconolactonase/LRE family protein [Allosphingosinicella sp.]
MPHDARTGRIHRLSPKLDALIDPQAPIATLAGGFIWAEGPVWIDEGRYLLLSDVPANRMYRWSEADGLSVFLDPSGYDGPDPSAFREPGSNGLIKGPGDTILIADHGNRAVASLDLATKRKTLLATHHDERRFNSPNDLVLAPGGAVYFTDPPYGLEGLNDSPLKEQPHNGVYRLDPDGDVALMDSTLTFPNGILLSPDARTLYVANSDPARAIWKAFALDGAGTVVSSRIFADVTHMVGADRPGLPDGMAIDSEGHLWATGPGGVLVFAPDGALLGRIETGSAIANCTFGEDGHSLFLAAHDRLMRVRTRARGARIAPGP